MKEYTFAIVTPELWEEILNTAEKIKNLAKEGVPLEIGMQAIMLVTAQALKNLSASTGADIETLIEGVRISIRIYSEFMDKDTDALI